MYVRVCGSDIGRCTQSLLRKDSLMKRVLIENIQLEKGRRNTEDGKVSVDKRVKEMGMKGHGLNLMQMHILSKPFSDLSLY